MLPGIEIDRCVDVRSSELDSMNPAGPGPSSSDLMFEGSDFMTVESGVKNSKVPTFARFSCSSIAPSRNGAFRFTGASIIGFAGAAAAGHVFL